MSKINLDGWEFRKEGIAKELNQKMNEEINQRLKGTTTAQTGNGGYVNKVEMILATVVAIAVIVFAVWGMKILDSQIYERNQKIIDSGYDLEDVKVFLKGTDFSLHDFMSSKGLRVQYKSFSEGQSAGFIQDARNRKKTSEAKSQAATATAISLVSLSNSMSNK